VRVTEHEQHFTDESAEAYWDELAEHHPMAVPARGVLEEAGTYEAVRSEAIAVLDAGNEVSEGFRITSPYYILRADKLSD
jgi:hypothetical protein